MCIYIYIYIYIYIKDISNLRVKHSVLCELNEKLCEGQFEQRTTWTKMKRLVIRLAESIHIEVRPDPLIGLEHDICESEMAFPAFRTWQVARVAWSHCGWFMYVLTNRVD